MLSIFVSGEALAQKCNADFEVITRLRKPEIGSYNMWDTVYGLRADIERFVGGVASVSKNAVVVGERYFEEGAEITLVMAELDRRGRVVWEKAHEVKGLRKIVKFLPDKNGYVVVADQKEGKSKDRIWIGFFDLNGGLVKTKTISDKKFNLFAQDMIASHDEKGFVLAATAQGRGYESGGYAILYRLNAKAQVIADRAYMPGLENRILGLSRSEGPYYIATGFIRSEDGRKTGWALKLDSDNAIVWQRQYPRGLAAQIQASADYQDPYFVVIGDAEPSDRKNRAGWVMLLSSEDGSVGWQRYYTGTLDFHGRDVFAHDDGQLSVLLDAEKPPGVDELEYARVLTLSPRGVLLLSDTYYHAEGTGAYDLFLGPNQERILAGYSDMVYRDEDPEHPEEDVRISRSREGWVVAGAPAEPYNDPCIQSYDFIP
ncbi:MAG: hypothetical protein DHS20C02_08390 [Micavibrio sp.]|nr:MAG: hypothetical protein DHS20C02_08390 [Micavibrio sp.]